MRIDWNNEPRLGKVPDAQLARALGLAQVSVRRARERRGIPATKGARGPRPALLLTLKPHTLALLEQAAREAGMTVEETARALLEVALEEGE
jgi:hypothetical protein